MLRRNCDARHECRVPRACGRYSSATIQWDFRHTHTRERRRTQCSCGRAATSPGNSCRTIYWTSRSELLEDHSHTLPPTRSVPCADGAGRVWKARPGMRPSPACKPSRISKAKPAKAMLESRARRATETVPSDDVSSITVGLRPARVGRRKYVLCIVYLSGGRSTDCEVVLTYGDIHRTLHRCFGSTRNTVSLRYN